jgi:DNA invertase Pin-like site-specific DNA recombinase
MHMARRVTPSRRPRVIGGRELRPLSHIAEFERTLIISRTNDGRIAAKARGVAFGRPKKMRPDQQQVARELVRDGKSISAVARTFDVHPATIYRVIEP